VDLGIAASMALLIYHAAASWQHANADEYKDPAKKKF
jgi:hypothetical protein